MKHWCQKYIGKPWHRHYDCFAHFVQVQAEQFNIKSLLTLEHLPEVLDYGAALRFVENDKQVKASWEAVAVPREGDAVIFAMGPIKFHIGTWLAIGGGGVLHCTRAQGVLFTPRNQFQAICMKVKYYLRARTNG